MTTLFNLALVTLLPYLAIYPAYRIIPPPLISKLSSQAVQAEILLYIRSCYPTQTVSLLLATDRITCLGWKETLLSMRFTYLATESQQQRLLRGMAIKYITQPTFGPGLNPWGVNYLINVLPASATLRRVPITFNVLNKIRLTASMSLYYLDFLITIAKRPLSDERLHKRVKPTLVKGRSRHKRVKPLLDKKRLRKRRSLAIDDWTASLDNPLVQVKDWCHLKLAVKFPTPFIYDPNLSPYKKTFISKQTLTYKEKFLTKWLQYKNSDAMSKNRNLFSSSSLSSSNDVTVKMDRTVLDVSISSSSDSDTSVSTSDSSDSGQDGHTSTLISPASPPPEQSIPALEWYKPKKIDFTPLSYPVERNSPDPRKQPKRPQATNILVHYPVIIPLERTGPLPSDPRLLAKHPTRKLNPERTSKPKGSRNVPPLKTKMTPYSLI